MPMETDMDLTLLLLLILATPIGLLLIYTAFDGAVSIYSWMCESMDILGLIGFLAAWIFFFPVMAVASLGVGILNELNKKPS